MSENTTENKPEKLIHPTAIIGPEVELPKDIQIGPYCVLEGKIKLGTGNRLLGSVNLNGPIEIGDHNTFYPQVSIGFPPQAHWFTGETAGVKIGHGNTFRESFTMHAGGSIEEATTVGDSNLFMTCSHIGHDCVIGNNCNIASGTALGGHCEIADQVNIGGSSGIHQFVRFGRMSFLGGVLGISADIPPFCIMGEVRKITGLNLVGLRRSGATRFEIKYLKRVFEILLLEEHTKPVAIEMMNTYLSDLKKTANPEDLELAQEFLDFCSIDSKRGLSRHSKEN